MDYFLKFLCFFMMTVNSYWSGRGRYQKGWIFGKVPNSLWHPPSFSEILLQIFRKTSSKTYLTVQNLQYGLKMTAPPPLCSFSQNSSVLVTSPLPYHHMATNFRSILVQDWPNQQELVSIYFQGAQHFDKRSNTAWNSCVIAIPFVCSRGLFVNVCKKDFIFGTQSDLSTVMAFCFRDSFEARLSKKISSLIIISSVWVRTVLLILPVCLTNLFTLSSSSLYSVTPPVTKLTSASVATATILICESSERPGEDSVWYSPQPSHASRRLGIVLPDSPALPKGTDRLLPERGRGAGSFHVQYLFPVRFPYLSIWCPRNHLFHISISWKPGFWLAPRN